jgi:hypothetical protein
MRCCGVENMTDWLHLPDRKIPESCCLEDLRTCRTALNEWTAADNRTTESLINSLEVVRKYLNEDVGICKNIIQNQNCIYFNINLMFILELHQFSCTGTCKSYTGLDYVSTHLLGVPSFNDVQP